MNKVMYTFEEVVSLINANKKLLLAGDEQLLEKLPKGDWIGGSIPYFMAESGGLLSKELIQVNEIPSYITEVSCKSYNLTTIENVYSDGFDNGFSVVIIPASSETHLSFAIHAPEYVDFATKPLIGWVSGVQLDDLGKVLPKTFNGCSSSASESDAVVMHVALPKEKYADISIVNIFQQGEGDTIEFLESGFRAKEALINGVKQNFADYVIQNNLDVRLPLVADYSSTMINISFQNINQETKEVDFYAPVFEGIAYKQAAPINDYIKEFVQLIPTDNQIDPTFSCNCILNYLYSELEGKKTGTITGPITFGEIAYQLLNQTMVNLEIKDL